MLLQKILESGRKIEFDRRNELHILGHECVWHAQSGCVDIFLSQKKKNGKTSSLRHIFTIPEGGFIFGIMPTASMKDWIIIAKPSLNATIVRVEQNIFESYYAKNKKEAGHLIDNWIRNISGPSIVGEAPIDYIQLSENDQDVYPEESIISTEHNVVWTKFTKGTASFLGDDRYTLNNKSIPFPICNSTWLVCEGGGEARNCTTEQLANIFDCLQEYHSIIIENTIKSLLIRKQQETITFRQRLKGDRVSVESALSRIGSFFITRRHLLSSIKTGNALFDVCNTIGKHMDVKFTFPKKFNPELDVSENIRLICHYSQIRHRRVALEGCWWKHDHGPLLALWGAARIPVVLILVKDRNYVMLDPSNNSKTKVDESLAKQFEPFAYSFYKGFSNDVVCLKDVIRLATRGSKKDLMVIFFMAIAGAILNLIVPLVTGKLFSVVIPEAATGLLWQLILALVAAAFGMTAFQMTSGVALQRIGGKADVHVEGAIWDRILKLPVNFFHAFSAGDLAIKAQGFNRIITSMLALIVTNIVSAIFIVFSLGILFYFSVKLAIVGFLTIFVFDAIIFFMLSFKIRREFLVSQLYGRLAGLLGDYICGISKIRTSACEGRVFANWSKLFIKFRQKVYSSEMVGNITNSFNVMIPIISSAIIFLTVSSLIHSKEISIGIFLAFNSAFGMLVAILITHTKVLAELLTAIPIYKGTKPILTTCPEVSTIRRDPGELRGGIEISNVHFRYNNNAPWVLKDISFSIKPGEFVAIVGPSGSGKSTLFRLLIQFETPNRGSIFYDGQSLQELDITLVRRQLGVVLQNGQLLPGDILGNIIGSAPLTMEDAWDSAHKTGLDRDIKDMPMGMYTLVSEGGGGFSGGQKQRLLIARAIVQKPRIMFFDEATSALDNETQAIVSKSLTELKSTRVVIAHRLSTIIKADKIIVLKEGHLVETGNYDELMARNGIFAELAKRQIA